LISESADDYTIDYSYNTNSSLIQEVSSRGSTVKYEYDSEERLVGIETPEKKIGLTLAPDGRMLRMKVNDDEFSFIYDGVNIIQKIAPSGQVTNFLYGLYINEIVARFNGNQTDYYHRALSNSVVQMSDAQGSITSHFSYDAFGNLLDDESPNNIDFGFAASLLLTSQPEKYHFRERVYSPRTGTFHSLDPIRAEAAKQLAIFNIPNTESQIGESPLYQQRLQVNLKGMDVGGYLYAGNNPVMLNDPTGAIIIWNPISGSVTSGCAASGCPGSGCGGSGCGGSGCGGSACGGSGCGGSICAGSACVGSICGGSACGGSVCGGSACAMSVCGVSACGGSVCAGSACGTSGCIGSICSQSGCVGSICAQSGCVGSACSQCK
jgi:YD repeat-containing protein